MPPPAPPLATIRHRPLALGLSVLALAWLGPLPVLAQEWFVAHMLMHVAVVAIAAPLLGWALAGPWAGWSAAGAGALTLAASLVELAVVWAWHAPALHHLARAQGGWMAVEQGMFLASALVVWAAALAAAERGQGLSGVVALMMTSMHMTFLGALLALGPHDLFTHGHDADGPAWDQQAGGLLMLLVGGASYMIGGLGILARLLRASDEETDRPKTI